MVDVVRLDQMVVAPEEDRAVGMVVDQVVRHTLAHAADQAWTQANDLYERAFAQWQLDCERIKQVGGDLPGQPVEPGSFDYEFLPFWLRACVDWSDISDVRVRTTVS